MTNAEFLPLMTLHTCKGLEFSAVFLVGNGERTFAAREFYVRFG